MPTRQKSSQDSGLNFEAQLWAAADKMRGHMDALEYKHVCLGLGQLAGTTRRGRNHGTDKVAPTPRRVRRTHRHLCHDHQASESRRVKAEVRMQNAGTVFFTSTFIGYDHSLISSNKTLGRTIKEYTLEKFTGDRASNRPDLFLAQNLRGGYLLIEFKRPSKDIDIDRQDQRQAQEYRDDLEPKFGQNEIPLLGKGRDVTAAIQSDPPRLQVLSYEALISAARTQLNWLLS